MELKLYRFSKRQHIRALVEVGEIYLSPASRFSGTDSSNGAYDPTELYIDQTIPAEATWELFDGKTGVAKGPLPVLKAGPMRSQSDKDYYVFCMSYRYTHALYREFEADTCLIIRDPDRFINQVGLGLHRQLPGWAINAGTVSYLPPQVLYEHGPTYQDIFYAKPWSYRNQCEVRIVCSPPGEIPKLEPIKIQIGTVADYTAITGIERPDLLLESRDWINSWASPFGLD